MDSQFYMLFMMPFFFFLSFFFLFFFPFLFFSLFFSSSLFPFPFRPPLFRINYSRRHTDQTYFIPTCSMGYFPTTFVRAYQKSNKITTHNYLHRVNTMFIRINVSKGGKEFNFFKTDISRKYFESFQSSKLSNI